MIDRDRDYLDAMSDAWAGGWKDPRDSQRQKVYNAEYRVRAQLDLSRDGENGFQTTEEIKAWVEKVLRSRWWKSYIIPFSRNKFDGGVNVKISRRTRTAVAMHTQYGDAVYIELPRRDWAWNKLVVLHELAHYPSAGRGVPSHGWLFCHVFLSLVRRFLSVEAHKMLRDEYDARNVRWRRPRQLSEETRRVLSERMSAMAATRWEGHVKKEVEDVDYVTLTDNQTWIIMHLMDDFEQEERVLDYHHDVDNPIAGKGRISRLQVTKMSIRDVAVCTSCAWQEDKLSLLGLLKKMKRHSYQMFMEVVDECDAFRYLPYSLSNEY